MPAFTAITRLKARNSAFANHPSTVLTYTPRTSQRPKSIMSFLTRVVPARSVMTGASFQAYRSFSTTLVTQRGPIEATKNVLKKADRTVSDAAVKGIETGETLTHKAQETFGSKSKEARGKAKEVAGEAKGEAHELEGKAKGKAEELRNGLGQ